MRRRTWTTLVAIAGALCVLGSPHATATAALAADRDLALPPSEPVDEVDPLIGTFAPGFTVPGAATPFGMVQVSPDTESPLAYSGYLWTDQLITGFSHTHLSGPGVPKAGDVPLMPTVGPVLSSDHLLNASPFSHAAEHASPGDYRVRLARGGIDVELAATTRTGMQRYTFPPGIAANVLLDVSRSIEGEHDASLRVIGDREVEGSVSGRYRVFFVARFSKPFTSTGTWRGSTLTRGGRAVSGPGVGGWVSFGASLAPQPITVKVGISFVDIAGARANLESESPSWDIGAVRAEGRAAWDHALRAITIDGGTPTDRVAFTTALYHAQLHPNVFSDIDGRYRGFDDAIHTTRGGAHYANFSSWDTYKAHNQLLSLIAPERYQDMALSLLADAQQGGRLPRWGEQHVDASHMSGDPVVPFLVDGLCRGALEGLDPPTIEQLYEQMRALALEHREPALQQLGYLPLEASSRGAGTTLEYGVADFALALAAHRLGHPADAARFAADAERWRLLFDDATGFVRPRHADTSWLTPFQPTAETGFQEGNAWQYTWLAPHDARQLFDAMGGDAAAVGKLDTLFSQLLASTTPVVVAEAQNRATAFGLVYRTNQYAPGNEHDLQVPGMYSFTDQPWKGQAVLRQVQGIFRAAPNGLPGNDDLGALSAWHVLSSIGLGPVTPGAPFWVIGSPSFERSAIRLGESADAGTFTITAPGTSPLAKYVGAAWVDGAQTWRGWLPDRAVRPGGSLRLEMRATPNEAWASAPANRPPSSDPTDLDRFGCTATP
jgi:predicted alpha-1,2-mannosidase